MSDVFLGDLPLWSDPNARAVLEGLWGKKHKTEDNIN